MQYFFFRNNYHAPLTNQEHDFNNLYVIKKSGNVFLL